MASDRLWTSELVGWLPLLVLYLEVSIIVPDACLKYLKCARCNEQLMYVYSEMGAFGSKNQVMFT